MNTLPPEILSLICSHLNVSTLKTMRLVNRTFNEFGARLVFKNVCFLLSQRSMDNLTKIAFHPTLQHYVRGFHYYGELFDSWWVSYTKWEESADLREPLRQYWESWRLPMENLGFSGSEIELMRRFLLRSSLNVYYRRALSFYTDQFKFLQAVFGDPGLLKRFSYVLSRFPNLCSIKSIRQEDEEISSAGFVRETGLIPVLSRLRKGTLQPYPFTCEPIPVAARPLAFLIVALSLSRASLGHFEAREIHPCFWTASDPWCCWDRIYLHLATAFRHLTTLRLSILVEDSKSFHSKQTVVLNSIITFVQSAPELRTLILGFKKCEQCEDTEEESPLLYDKDSYWKRYLFTTSKLMDSLNLPSLKHLGLKSFTVTEQSLRGFIERHSLAYIHFVNAQIVAEPGHTKAHGAWQRTARTMASHYSLLDCVLFALMDSSIRDRPFADTDDDRAYHRYCIYSNAISAFIRHKGQMEFPVFEYPLVMEMKDLQTPWEVIF